MGGSMHGNVPQHRNVLTNTTMHDSRSTKRMGKPMDARTLGLWTLGLLLSAAAPPAHAQIKASERGGVHQTIDGTTITVDYARPRARGRSPLFGDDVVHWEHVWTRGADWATTLEINKPVTIQGHEIPVGKYSVWFVVEDTTAWEVWLEPKDSLWHIPEPERTDEQIHFMADVEHQDVFFETLTWWFPETRMAGTTLAMQWGTTYVPLEIRVEPSIELTVSAEAAAPILGTYAMTAEGERSWWNRRIEIVYDSSRSWPRSTWYERETEEDANDDGATEGHEQDTGDADGTDTTADTSNEADEDDPPWEAALLLVTDEWFTPAWLQDGELWSASKSMTLEFEFEYGRATGFQLRNRKDEVVGKATRVD